MSELRRFGIVGTSRKQSERRIPIHPAHFDRIPGRVARRLVFERGYGERFGVSDDALENRFAGVAERSELLGECDGVLLLKPVTEDLRELREGAVLWGWPHCVQQREITDTAVERGHTLLAFESMYLWSDGARGMHLFYRNNELAGYCAVLHALSLRGETGHFGRPLRATVVSFGSVSRGAIRALQGLGIHDFEVYTLRAPWAVRDRMAGGLFGRMVRDPEGAAHVLEPDGTPREMVEAFSDADVIVNGILQDTDAPIMFMAPGEEGRLRPGSLIVDVSCDRGMGFPFARPTSFGDPTFRVGPALYYAIDHTPSWLWRSASWELSDVIVAYLGRVLSGPEAWEEDETLRRAIEIQAGEILNPKILSFRSRGAGG
jgi:alanine dehydrogenase